MRGLRVASCSWRCHGNAEDTALGPCTVVGRGGQGTVPALLLPELQWEGSELGPAVALHENETPEPQPLPCRCFPCSLEVGLTLNTKVFLLQPTQG